VKAPVPTERQTQRAILGMIGRSFPAVFVAHVPNGAHLAGGDVSRFKQMGALKGDGLKKGFPDLIAYWNHGHALIEVKRPGFSPSQVSEDQSRIHQTLLEMGWRVAVVSSTQEAFEFLRERGAPWNGVPA
jgi:VRR-NUC domain